MRVLPVSSSVKLLVLLMGYLQNIMKNLTQACWVFCGNHSYLQVVGETSVFYLDLGSSAFFERIWNSERPPPISHFQNNHAARDQHTIVTSTRSNICIPPF